MADPPLAISNLAWTSAEDAGILPRLVSWGAQGVEVAPWRLGAWTDLEPARLRAYRTLLAANGLVASSLQAVFYGREDVALLHEEALFNAMCEHMKQVAEIASALDSRRIVFGAPRQRRRGALEPAAAMALAAERLARLGAIAADAGACLGIEPVPAIYGGDFLETAEEVMELVRRINHPGVRVHLDTACVTLGGGDIGDAIAAAGADLAHFHLAEPDLGDFTTPRMPHARAFAALAAAGYQGWTAVEMLGRGMDDAQRVRTALAAAIAARNAAGAPS